jgi:hypothetical protein
VLEGTVEFNMICRAVDMVKDLKDRRDNHKEEKEGVVTPPK